ncbi:hypothetical protein LQV05_002885 [Cryptococcus neoformans]|nr:hypothetical protein LQV05_002885 [Cryptococcus neoformans]
MPPKGLMHKDTPLNEDMNTLSVEGAQHSVTPQTRPHLSHPISYYYQPSNPLPYCLSPAGNTFASSSPKKTDAMIVTRLATATKPVPTAVKLDDNLKLAASIDPDETSYTLFHPPLVIQASAAADGCTSIATSPAALRFLLDTGASTSFCCSVRVRVM